MSQQCSAINQRWLQTIGAGSPNGSAHVNGVNHQENRGAPYDMDTDRMQKLFPIMTLRAVGYRSHYYLGTEHTHGLDKRGPTITHRRFAQATRSRRGPGLASDVVAAFGGAIEFSGWNTLGGS